MSNIRKATINDVNDIMLIIRQAQQFLAESNIDQWQNNYPNEDSIKEDIKNSKAYVCVDNDIVGYFALSISDEKTYDVIDGKWLSNDEYVVLHRLAIANSYKGKGYGKIIIDYVKDLAKSDDIQSIKIDTHEKNANMRRFLEKNEFIYCGIITLEYGALRVAYELFGF